jgi:predicted RecB family nuclease
MDLFGNSAKRDPINVFVQLLWERGSAHEKEIIAGLSVPFLDLSIYSGAEKERLTLEAMQRKEPLIYSGRISADDLLGEPDLLRLASGGYIAGDIKSGAGEEGDEDQARLKKHYAVQLALYTDILERMRLSGGRAPFVWDIHGEEVIYPLDELQGQKNPTSMWQVYQNALRTAIVSKTVATQPAYGAPCKLCHWHSACLADLENGDDLTLLPELGRSKRDVMVASIATVTDLAAMDVNQFVSGKKTTFKGIGPDSLAKFQKRAKLARAKDAKPYLTAPVRLPATEVELFFDIEVDPMRDICYLHGFVERKNDTESYHAFFSDGLSAAEEEQAFAGAWKFIQDRRPCAIYYYSKYERTIWRKLQEKYPTVCSAADIEALFDPARSIDLYYDVVKKATEWPTRDHSIKTLAQYLGFKWRDTHPSGAASIEWFHRWIETGDTAVRQRILDYNEDDCLATRVLLDGIRAL